MSHAVISDGPSHRRLFKVSGLEELGSVAISRAYLEFDVQGVSEDRVLHLSLSPVTTQWEPGSVQWRNGWTRPGGDFDPDLAAYASVSLSGDGRKATFDVTPIVKEVVEAGMECYGFILNVQPRVREDGIRGEDLGRLGGIQGADLIVEYRHVLPGPRRR